MSFSITCPLTNENESIKEFSHAVYSSVADASAQQWDKFVPEGNMLMQSSYLQMLEDTHGRQMQFRYVYVKREDITVGVLYFQIVRFEAAQLMNYFPEGNNWWMNMTRRFSHTLLSSINLQLLVSGNTFMTGENGYYFHHSIDAETRGKLVRQAAREICRKTSSVSAVLISDLYAPKTVFDNGFVTAGYYLLNVESDMHLTLQSEWKTFNDYLAALSSKYRVRARKVLSLCSENNVTHKDLSATEIEDFQDTIYQLYNKVMAKADFKLSMLSKTYFSEQKKIMPEQYHLRAYFKNGAMIGFISWFTIGKKTEIHYVGMDHDVCKPIHLYQHMMYDMVQVGIENGVEKLHFGRTAPEIKSTIGAAPSPMYGYLKHLNPIFNFLAVRTYTSNLRPKEYTYRNPFKS